MLKSFLDQGKAQIKRRIRQFKFKREGKIYSDIWKALNQTSLESFEEVSASFPTEINQEEVEAYFQQTSQYKIMDLKNLKEKDRLFLDNHNISSSNLLLISKNAKFIKETLSGGLNQDFKNIPERLVSSLYILETGYLDTVCPISGRILRSNQSFKSKDIKVDMLNMIYRFVSHEVFYLVFFDTIIIPLETPTLIYFPRLDLIITIKTHPKRDIKAYSYPQDINYFKAFIVTNWQKVLAYTKYNKRREIISTVGFTSNITHHLANDLSGIESLLKTGMINKASKFLVGKYEYYGRLEEIFPEINPAQVIRLKDNESISEFCLENNYFLINVRDDCISEDLVIRIYQASVKKCPPSLLSKVEEAKKHFPLISIPLRSSVRVWVSEVEGIANIIRKLSDEFPDLGVVFEGFCSFGESTDINESPKKSEKTIQALIKKEKAVVKQVSDLLYDKNIAVYSTVGSMMYESVVWAHAVDFYIGSIGSNLTRVTAIANKPGIMHGNTYLIETDEQREWLSKRRENTVIPTIVPPHHIPDQYKGIENFHDDYDVDWKIIYDEAMKLIPQLSRK